MKTYTVKAHCQHVDTRYTLRHDGEKWTEKAPFEETLFPSFQEAQAFADEESKGFEVRHTMVIEEFNCEEE